MKVSFLKRPWVHFVAIGLALFIASDTLQEPERMVVNAPDSTRINELKTEWTRATGRAPTEEQIARLVESEIDREILFQEAVRRGWHETDLIVRQRLIRNMKFLDPATTASDDELFENAIALSLYQFDKVTRGRLEQRVEMMSNQHVSQQDPGDEILRQRYEQGLDNPGQRDLLFSSPKIAMSHIFISRDTNADPEAKAQEVLLQAEGLSPQEAVKLGNPFLHGHHFNAISPKQYARYFGAEFSRHLEELASTQQQQWVGPINATYGEYIVWIESYEPAKQKTFEAVRSRLLIGWRREEERRLLIEFVAKLREKYEVVR